MVNEFGVTLDSNGYAPSIIQGYMGNCFECGRCDQKLDRHEVFHGPYRPKAKRQGLWVMLCHERCHLNGAHKNADIDRELKEIGQKRAMVAYGWSVDDFRKEYGKNYL